MFLQNCLATVRNVLILEITVTDKRERAHAHTPVSYTHLDVYKRQG